MKPAAALAAALVFALASRATSVVAEHGRVATAHGKRLRAGRRIRHEKMRHQLAGAPAAESAVVAQLRAQLAAKERDLAAQRKRADELSGQLRAESSREQALRAALGKVRAALAGADVAAANASAGGASGPPASKAEVAATPDSEVIQPGDVDKSRPRKWEATSGSSLAAQDKPQPRAKVTSPLKLKTVASQLVTRGAPTPRPVEKRVAADSLADERHERASGVTVDKFDGDGASSAGGGSDASRSDADEFSGLEATLHAEDARISKLDAEDNSGTATEAAPLAPITRSNVGSAAVGPVAPAEFGVENTADDALVGLASALGGTAESDAHFLDTLDKQISDDNADALGDAPAASNDRAKHA